MKYAIRVTNPDGSDMFVRHGYDIGRGAVVQFPSLKKARAFAEDMKLGLDSDQSVTVVLYGPLNIDDEKLA